MLALGFFAAFIMVTSQTLLQHETPQEMLGRVSSSLMSLMAVSQVLAMFVAGPVAQQPASAICISAAPRCWWPSAWRV